MLLLRDIVLLLLLLLSLRAADKEGNAPRERLLTLPDAADAADFFLAASLRVEYT